MLVFPFLVSSSSTLNIYLGPLEPCAGKDPLQVKWIYFHATFKVPMICVATWIRHGFEPSVIGASHDFAVSLAKHLAPAHTIPHASESHLRRRPEDKHHCSGSAADRSQTLGGVSRGLHIWRSGEGWALAPTVLSPIRLRQGLDYPLPLRKPKEESGMKHKQQGVSQSFKL